MPFLERRLEQLEKRIPTGALRNVRDVSELSTLELCVYLLEQLAADYPHCLEAPVWQDIAARGAEYAGNGLADPVERYIADLLREALDAGGALLTHRFHGRFPERILAAAHGNA